MMELWLHVTAHCLPLAEEGQTQAGESGTPWRAWESGWPRLDFLNVAASQGQAFSLRSRLSSVLQWNIHHSASPTFPPTGPSTSVYSIGATHTRRVQHPPTSVASFFPRQRLTKRQSGAINTHIHIPQP